MSEAAGGVVWRLSTEGTLEVLLVHRPRYDDWSLPKGKLDAGETHREAALREVEEETGLRCRADAELPTVRYRDREGRSKRVRYWVMRPTSGTFVPSDEVDEIRWVPISRVGERLTYERDVEVVEAITDLALV